MLYLYFRDDVLSFHGFCFISGWYNIIYYGTLEYFFIWNFANKLKLLGFVCVVNSCVQRRGYLKCTGSPTEFLITFNQLVVDNGKSEGRYFPLISLFCDRQRYRHMPHVCVVYSVCWRGVPNFHGSRCISCDNFDRHLRHTYNSRGKSRSHLLKYVNTLINQLAGFKEHTTTALPSLAVLTSKGNTFQVAWRARKVLDTRTYRLKHSSFLYDSQEDSERFLGVRKI